MKLAIVWNSDLRFTYCCSSLLWNAFEKILYIIQLSCVVSVGPSWSVHHLSMCLDVKEMWVEDYYSINLNAFLKKNNTSSSK